VSQSYDLEAMLSRALAPVDPPLELELRLELTLGSLVVMAVDELESWELSSMRDPRNWTRILRPLGAVLVGGTAAVGLVVLRTQRGGDKRRRGSRNVLELASRTLRDGAHEARRVLEEIPRRR
jgi:hypothetical protein